MKIAIMTFDSAGFVIHVNHTCGCRCIQVADQPIILTGFSALNKLLGREVYSSQMQLGGPKVSSLGKPFCVAIAVHSHINALLCTRLSVSTEYSLRSTSV